MSTNKEELKEINIDFIFNQKVKMKLNVKEKGIVSDILFYDVCESYI